MSQENPSAPASGRVYLDQYIVQFTRNEVMKMTAMTPGSASRFRDMAEKVIRTFDFGPSDSSLPAAPSPTPRPAHTPAAEVNALARRDRPSIADHRSPETSSG